jgi:hypothetical protein
MIILMEERLRLSVLIQTTGSALVHGVRYTRYYYTYEVLAACTAVRLETIDRVHDH